MAGNAPYTVEIPLKRRDRVEACPEKTGCQLAVEIKPKSQALALVDTGMGGMAVQVKLVREGKGCEAEVHVGLVENTGYPLAVGNTGGLWEHRLILCQPPGTVLLEHLPRHLLNVRYPDGDRGFISLIVYQDIDNNWQVVVERSGPLPSVYRLSYAEADDDLVVTAALSRNLESLYITESRRVSVTRSTTWYWHTWSRYTGEWSLWDFGKVPVEAYNIAMGLAHRVDRDGHIHGYWGGYTTTRKEYDSSGGSCQTSWEGHVTFASYQDYTEVYGGFWSIIDKQYHSGRQRCRGLSLSGQDMGLVMEARTGYTCTRRYSHQAWSHHEPAKFTDQVLTVNDDEYFAVSVGGSDIGLQSKDYGVNSHRVGRFDGSYSPPVGGGMHEVDYAYSWPSWSWHDGVIAVGCTHGGWVTRSEEATVKQADLTPYSWHVSSADAPDGFCLWPLSWLESYAEERIAKRNVATKTIVYPHNLGAYYAILGSFIACDRQTGITYSGALVQPAAEAASEWHIFRDGAEITAEVAACIGVDLDQFNAIYWRA